MSDKPKLSPVEGFKTESNYLRGTIGEELTNGDANFGKASVQLLKHHGTYEQDDRDRRKEAKANKIPGGKYYSLMTRTVIPGGILTSEQMLGEIAMGDDLGNSTIRLTTRQGIQLHGILKSDLKEHIRRVSELKLTTLAACGDVARNMMCSPVPMKNAVYDDMQDLAARLKEHFKPQTSSYFELWLKGDDEGDKKELVAGGAPEGEDPIEPIYGATYLPRKFKMGIGLPEDNNADIYSQDLGFLAITEGSGDDRRIVGYNLLVGGGFGRTPSKKDTFAAVAQSLCYAAVGEEIAIAEAIMKVQRDFGNRADRKLARMKYLIGNWGLEKFKTKVEEYAGHDLVAPLDVSITDHNDGMGWQEQGDGLWFYGLAIESGRIKDEGDYRIKQALREICTKMAPPLRITAHQNLIFCDLKEEDKQTLETILKEHGVPLTEEVSLARRWSMACPALPTCGLAVTESERYMPSLIDELDIVIAKLGLQKEVFTMRMTGCPNGCARPYNSDIGLVGKAREKYTVFLGGSHLGHRLNWVYQDMVPATEVTPMLGRVFTHFKAERQGTETFGDFCDRLGQETLAAACEPAVE